MTDTNDSRQNETAPRPVTRIVDSHELFGGQKTVLIRHHDEFYRLLLTKNGKLILQK